ncbi:hypothetical protein B5X24_HaOG214035 [Helicoverpa armigera]|uniref:Uncharacterized protein n=1 Tax=Helicoverpa armigera TaxID=29058 RepID=A0A2W1B817_HELAM|nr:hypothetical protein B5X24_HaOG214035 [Helicoverpa armigera]
MNRDSPEGGGFTIRGRKSIHEYQISDQAIEIMGRYGIGNPSNQAERDVVDQGVDVVDNVMSKMARQTSPLTIRKKKIPRTNSYPHDEENTDEDSTNVLSKSLPATLPSHLPYSDDSDVEQNYLVKSLSKSRIEDESFQHRLNRSDHSSERQTLRKLSISSEDTAQTQSGNTFRNILIALILGFIAVMVHKMLPNITNSSQDKSTQTVNHDKIIFENNMKNLQEKYNIDDNSILKLKTGISTIFSRMDTGSFMFVYNSKTNNFNAVRFDKFTDEVAFTAARYLRSNIASIQHTVVESADLDMQDHGQLITRYRDDVDRSGVMLVKEIDSVPSQLAMAFHYYCDEYDPVVKRSAIFFTLNMANCSNTAELKSTHAFIEKCLANRWKNLPPENVRPLLTRVVDIVIDVTSVF